MPPARHTCNYNQLTRIASRAVQLTERMQPARLVHHNAHNQPACSATHCITNNQSTVLKVGYGMDGWMGGWVGLQKLIMVLG